jgi:hypothetical protein
MKDEGWHGSDENLTIFVIDDGEGFAIITARFCACGAGQRLVRWLSGRKHIFAKDA